MLPKVAERPDVPSELRPREDIAAPRRLQRSAVDTDGRKMSIDDFDAWFDQRRAAHRFQVDRIPFAGLDMWSFDESTGNLRHRSGRFFTVEGLHAIVDRGPHREWRQPIIRQPEVGILGIVVKEFDGVLHFLMQAKMEPGNRNLLQLSPTVQATRSNYTKVHNGSSVRYMDYFTSRDRGRVIADVLQSEHGAWFYRKSNRNMIVEAVDDVPLHEDFCWLTLGQLGELLRRDNTVNMDSRTVLACVPIDHGETGALHSDTGLLSWFTTERSRHEVNAVLTPLRDVPDWERTDWSIDHRDGRYFSVVAVSVRAGNREVSRWTQPLFEPRGQGVTAFLTRRIGGVRHVLVSARIEGGFLDTVELGPTVQCTPHNYAHLPPAWRPRFLERVLAADPAQIHYDVVHSEEGGRFLNAESRHMLVEVGDDVPIDPPAGYCWVTPGQLTSLVQHGHYVNVQARTLIACLNAMAARS